MRTAELPATVQSRSVFRVVLLGAFLLHLAWILAVPTFGGSDEFDHVYKADAAAHGQLRGSEDAADGRGQLLAVRPDLVEAAEGVCSSYEYTGPDNCTAVAGAEDGRVQIASAAASYNPTYYVLVGSLATPLDGAAYDVGLRLITAALASALLAAAVALAASRAHTMWPVLALAVCVTPTLVYSGSIAAPNGVGYAAACLWWVCALALVEDRRPPYVLLTLASVVVLTTHTLNVMWLPLMVIVVLLLRSARWWRDVVREPRFVAVAGTVLLAALACLAWIRSSGTNQLNEPIPGQGHMDVADLPSLELVWSLQTIASFPLRDQAEHPATYALWLGVLGYVLLLGFRAAGTTVRLAMAGILTLWLVIPVVLTAVSYASEGYAWQGRYALPLVMGLPLLAGMALDRRGVEVPPVHLHLSLAGLTLVHVWCVLALALRESDRGLSPALAGLLPVAGAMAVVGSLAVAAAVVVVAGWRATTAVTPDLAPAVTR